MAAAVLWISGFVAVGGGLSAILPHSSDQALDSSVCDFGRTEAVLFFNRIAGAMPPWIWHPTSEL